MNPLAEALRSRSGPLLAELEGIYKDLHQHPELSMQEVRTAGIAADYLEALGYEVARGSASPVSWECCAMAPALP